MKKLLYILLALILVVLAAVLLLHWNQNTRSEESPRRYTPSPVQSDPEPDRQTAPETEPVTESATEPEPQPDTDSWMLTLVNATHTIPDDAIPTDLTDLFNGEQVDSRIYPDLQQMFDDARAQGVYPLVNEGYRTHARQQELMDQQVDAYIAEGYDGETARQLAEAWVAAPGTSEHELGLAVDIVADTEKCANETVYTWLKDNAWQYGFILRYPEDKVDITGIDYEPWHYRYVGREAALEIYQQGLCLEEYLSAGTN